MYHSQILCSVCFCLILAVIALPQNLIIHEGIGFPEIEEIENIKNKQGRQPLFAPSMCSENELFYPGDQTDDWICDCRPAHLYHPASDKCWPAFRKGPCVDSDYLILSTSSVIPVCKRNPCAKDNYVLFNGNCTKLGSTDVCGHLYPTAAAVGVNATTLQLDCVRLSLEVRFGDAPISRHSCMLGSKRSVDNKCTPYNYSVI